MGKKQLGRLEKIDLREAWLSESSDFTPWLAQEKNLKLLSETIGIELECESIEKYVGPFRADIICKDTANDNLVLIENQLERTNHSHLGQLLTYAAGLNAGTIIWVAQQFTEEHRAALDWLNERTDNKINFFGLEIELWRIDSSSIAPKFNIISQPNDWSRTAQKAAGDNGELTEHRQLQLRFWTAFKQYMKDKGSFVQCQKSLPQMWTNHPIGRSGVHMSSIISKKDQFTNSNTPEIRAMLYLNGPNAKQEFAALKKQSKKIQRAFGAHLIWHNPEINIFSKIYTKKKADFLNEDLWPQQFEWLRQRLEKMHKVFSPILKKLDVSDSE